MCNDKTVEVIKESQAWNAECVKNRGEFWRRREKLERHDKKKKKLCKKGGERKSNCGK